MIYEPASQLIDYDLANFLFTACGRNTLNHIWDPTKKWYRALKKYSANPCESRGGVKTSLGVSKEWPWHRQWLASDMTFLILRPRSPCWCKADILFWFKLIIYCIWHQGLCNETKGKSTRLSEKNLIFLYPNHFKMTLVFTEEKNEKPKKTQTLFFIHQTKTSFSCF